MAVGADGYLGVMLDWLWVVGSAVAVALLTIWDTRAHLPYFSYSQAVFEFPILIEAGGAGPVKKSLLRRASYAFLAGLVLGALGRTSADAASAGFMAVALLIWPALVSSMPTHLARRRVILAVYGALAIAASVVSWLGWQVIRSFASPLGFLAYLKDQLLDLLVGAVLFAFAGSFADRKGKQMSRGSSDGV